MELAKRLSKKNFYIYFCSTPIILNSLKKTLSSHHLSFIELVELKLQSSPFELPPRYQSSNGLPHHHLPTLVNAFISSKLEFSEILNNLNPDLIIYDIFPPWITEIAFLHHIPAVHFMVSGAVSSSFIYSSFKKSLDQGNVLPFPSSTIFLKDSEMEKLKVAGVPSAIYTSFKRSSNISLIKTCTAVEGKYINYHQSLLTKTKVIPVGPLMQDIVPHNQERDEDIIQWLSKKEEASTVYVSFGTENILSQKEIEELAYGLELSNVNYIWVIRFPKGEKVTVAEALPAGFLERIGERGKIVEGWAPQAKILRHGNIGGFVSHCGWSSVIESLGSGVPIIAIPLQFEQPLNGRLVVELGVGLEVMKDENLEFKREEVARVLKKVVLEESREDIRNKTRELSEKIRVNGEEDMDYGAEELRKLCNKNGHIK